MKKSISHAAALRAALVVLLGGIMVAAARPDSDPRPAEARQTAAAVVNPATPASGPAAQVAAGAAQAAADVAWGAGEPAEVSAALAALAPRVKRLSDPGALRTAFRAYYAYRAAKPAAVKKPYLYFVDFGLSNSTPRGWVFDMDKLEVVEGPFTVAHGGGSSRTRNTVPTTFSNRPGSKATSLGLYLAQETYTFSGKAGGRSYTSVGLRMRGESGEFNDAARRRGIVAHGAPYVTASAAGRSQGCPAMEQARARRLLPLIANGGVVFLYSPNDERWLARDPWVKAD